MSAAALAGEPFKDKLSWALHHAARGCHVFPIIADGRTPAHRGWQQEATRDPDVIRSWWRHDPNYNVGIFTGRFGDDQALVVADVDTKNGKAGLDTFRRLDMFHGFDPTWKSRTASGGWHLAYVVDKAIGQGTNTLGPGIDTRSRGGYIVAPGSVVDTGTYEQEVDVEPAPCPQWILDASPAAKERAAALSTIGDNLDHPDCVDEAIRYLKDTAPHAEEGNAGDETTYKVACRLKDIGVSELAAHELLALHWNDTKASPPWSFEDLGRKVANAYSYGRNPIGAALPATLEFNAVPIPAESKRPTLLGRSFRDMPLDALPARHWLVPGLAMIGQVTSIVAPGAAGKSLLTLALAAAVAVGREVAGFVPTVRGSVLVCNNEDDADEMARRLHALAASGQVSLAELNDERNEILLASVSDGKGFKVVKRDEHGKLYPHAAADIIERLKAIGAKLWIVDPLVSIHEANENDNVEMDVVIRTIQRIAQRAGVAVVIVHHTRKPQGASSGGFDDQNAGRGASAIVNAVRVQVNLNAMTTEEAKSLGVESHERWRYLRLGGDGTKSNHAPPGATARWYRKDAAPFSFRHPDDGSLVPESIPYIRPVALAPAATASPGVMHARNVLQAIEHLGGPRYGVAFPAREIARAHCELKGVEATNIALDNAARKPREYLGGAGVHVGPDRVVCFRHDTDPERFAKYTPCGSRRVWFCVVEHVDTASLLLT